LLKEALQKLCGMVYPFDLEVSVLTMS